jgi:uncharacterized protein (TIGR02677 family)
MPHHFNQSLLAVFRHLNVDLSARYRDVIDVFTLAKAEFRLHLRPVEIAARMRDRGAQVSDEEVGEALDQLVEWGNLQAYHDSAEVASLADFQRRHFLYQLTAAGEAAERAIAEFWLILDRPVTLETEALARLNEFLGELGELARDVDPDEAKVARVLRTIADDAEAITAHAQSFFRWLHEQTAQRGADLASFIAYKERLIDYLRRFLEEMASQSPLISDRIRDIHSAIERLLQCAAKQETAGAFSIDEAEREHQFDLALERWQQRWLGLHRWFVGVAGAPQVKQLRLAAGAAIPQLLDIAAQLHDQRAMRSNRRIDLLTLASWFLQADDDRQAHRLWGAAFAAHPVRHWQVNLATLEQREQQPVPAHQSWLAAPPIYIAPELRRTGRATQSAPARPIVDRSLERRLLRLRLHKAQLQAARARQSLLAVGRRRLSEIGFLEHEALNLLLELLDRAAPARASGDEATATSEDGSLAILIDWKVPRQIASIESPLGGLHTDDVWVHVVEASALGRHTDTAAESEVPA